MQPNNKDNNQLIKNWIVAGGEVNWTTEGGMTLLHFAAMKGNADMAAFLLERGADVNAVNKSNETPLLWACTNIEAAVISVLLQHRADPNIASNGDTPLKMIRQSGLPEAKEMEQLLLGKGSKTQVGVTRLCDECGAPEPKQMAKRNVHVTLSGVLVDVHCMRCESVMQAPLGPETWCPGAMLAVSNGYVCSLDGLV